MLQKVAWYDLSFKKSIWFYRFQGEIMYYLSYLGIKNKFGDSEVA